jgi:RNA recognition motif. (a.k.a. RRM, RBD, or RNP domain)
LCEHRVVYVRNLPFNITPEEMYDIFGKFGALRQVRIGDSKETRGTAFVVYEVGTTAGWLWHLSAAQSPRLPLL